MQRLRGQPQPETESSLDQVLQPIILYLACVLGGVGVALALPRKGVSPRLIGAVLASAGGGLVVLFMGIKAAQVGQLPNVFFYAFALLALGAALRMISHPRPVYSALYFILTIIATCGLFVILSAEFMAFALIIIYAGAILITYLFVIMLATQAPREGDEELQAEYDTQAREPWMASLVGFVLLAMLTTMMFRGATELRQPAAIASADQALPVLVLKVDRELRAAGVLVEGERVHLIDGKADLDVDARTIVLADGETNAVTRVLGADEWPVGLVATNVEEVGINLLADHPMTIEIAGIILLMAMLGATVLARKQVELEETLKAAEARRLGEYLSERGGS